MELQTSTLHVTSLLFSALVTSAPLKYSGHIRHHVSGKTHATEKGPKEKIKNDQRSKKI